MSFTKIVKVECKKKKFTYFFAETHPILRETKDNTNRVEKKQVHLIFYSEVQFISYKTVGKSPKISPKHRTKQEKETLYAEGKT